MWLAVLCCVAASFGTGAPARGQDFNREYKLKAVYLYKFATYVEWPAVSFQDVDSPFVIGILGPDPLGASLRQIAKVKKIGGRTIEIQNYKQPEEVRDCHILFMSRATNSETQQAAINLLANRSILFVGETRNFLNQGGVFRFEINQNRVRVYISKPAYEREQLDVSAQLLRIATVIDPDE